MYCHKGEFDWIVWFANSIAIATFILNFNTAWQLTNIYIFRIWQDEGVQRRLPRGAADSRENDGPWNQKEGDVEPAAEEGPQDNKR